MIEARTIAAVLEAHPLEAAPPAPPRTLKPKARASNPGTDPRVKLALAKARGRDWTEGHRHDSLRDTASHARKLGLERYPIGAVLFELAIEAGLPDEETERVLNWAMATVTPDPVELDLHEKWKAQQAQHSTAQDAPGATTDPPKPAAQNAAGGPTGGAKEAGGEAPQGGPYCVLNGRLTWLKRERDGVAPVALCNFSCRIVEERDVDDGAERRRVLLIEGELANGSKLPRIEVPAASFAGLAWVTSEWGSRAIVSAGQSTRDRLREAIQVLSGSPERRTIMACTGWGERDGKPAFFHAGGAITEAGQLLDVEVSLAGPLAHVSLADPPDAPRDAVRASVEALLAVGPDRVIMPLLCAVARAPLGEVRRVDMALWLVGSSGGLKTSTAALAQAFFGRAFDTNTLPCGWESTSNALEKATFIAKDIVLVLDDFAPKGSPREIAELHGRADRMLRSIGNLQGRSRMNANGTFRPEYTPRGFVIVTGEDVPRGHSARARALFIDIAKGDVSELRLLHAQRLARSGKPTECMAAYLRWLAPRLGDLRETFPESLLELRAEVSGDDAHKRKPDQVASLLAGLDVFLSFARDVEAYTAIETEALRVRARVALCALGAAQGEQLASADPVRRFVLFVASVLLQGRAHVEDREHGGPPNEPQRWGWRRREGIGVRDATQEPQGRRIGWLDRAEATVLLDADAAFSEAQALASMQGEGMTLSKQGTLKALRERGFLGRCDTETGQVRNFRKVTKLPGVGTARLLPLKLSALFPESDTGPVLEALDELEASA